MALATGSDPGSARQVGQTWVLGGAPKVVLHPQNIFECVPSSTCVSSPSTGSNRSSASSYGITVSTVMLKSFVQIACETIKETVRESPAPSGHPRSP